MTLFKDMLRSDQTIFKDINSLDFEYVPKLLPFRDKEQRSIASCIQPLLQQRPGRNLFVYGASGIGKTAAVRWVFRDLEWDSDEVVPVYVNCWQKNTTYKILLEICDIVGYKFVQNKRTEQLFAVIKEILNKKSVVFAFDEVDKLEELDFLYMILEEIFRKSIVLITNYKEWLFDLDSRLKSRLVPEALEFRHYNYQETDGVLKERIRHAFFPGVFEDDAFDFIAKETFDAGDVRFGIKLLEAAGIAAEESSSKRVKLEHAKFAFRKLDDFTIKSADDLDADAKAILKIIAEHPGMRMGDVFNLYTKSGGQAVYKTFQRKIAKLEQDKFLSIEKVTGGAEGSTTIVKLREKPKKLTDF